MITRNIMDGIRTDYTDYTHTHIHTYTGGQNLASPHGPLVATEYFDVAVGVRLRKDLCAT